MRPSEKFQTAFVFGRGIVKNKLINKGFLTILCSGFTYLFAYVHSAFLKRWSENAKQPEMPPVTVPAQSVSADCLLIDKKNRCCL